MGATHHALEDYGALLCLPHLRAYVPAFDGDVAHASRAAVRGPAPGLPATGPLGRASRCHGPRLCPLEAAPGRARLGGPGDWPARRRDLGGRPAARGATQAGALAALRASLPSRSPSIPGRPGPIATACSWSRSTWPRGASPRWSPAACWRPAWLPERFATRIGPGLCLRAIRLPEVPPQGVRPRPRVDRPVPHVRGCLRCPTPSRRAPSHSPRRSASSRARSSSSAPAASSAPT